MMLPAVALSNGGVKYWRKTDGSLNVAHGPEYVYDEKNGHRTCRHVENVSKIQAEQ